MAGLENKLKKLRLEAGFSQQALAAMAGISRQAYSALEAGTASPSTEVALRLSRALARNVESVFFLPPEAGKTVEAELAGDDGLDFVSGVSPQRVRLYQVGRRIFARPLTGHGNVRHSVVPADAVIMGRTDPGGALAVAPFDAEELNTPTLAMLGCDPAVGLLEPELRRRGVRLAAAEESSRQALLGLARGEAHVAGCHLFDEATGTFNRSWVGRLVPFPCTLVTFASWQQGLMLAPGNPKSISGIGSLGRPEVSLVNRQAGSGSRALLDRELDNLGGPCRRRHRLRARGMGALGGRRCNRLRRRRCRRRRQGCRIGLGTGLHTAGRRTVRSGNPRPHAKRNAGAGPAGYLAAGTGTAAGG